MKFLVVFMFILQSSFASELKTCSANFCVKVSSEKAFSTRGESSFVLTLENLGNGSVILKKVDLWMDMGHHGHGSAPLKVTPVNSSVYNIKNAYFVMKGTWLIRVYVQKGDVSEKLEIPVLIND